MNYKIRLTAEAEKDLRGIFEYIAFDLQSVQNAVGQLERLERRIVSLNDMPEKRAVAQTKSLNHAGRQFSDFLYGKSGEANCYDYVRHA